MSSIHWSTHHFQSPNGVWLTNVNASFRALTQIYTHFSCHSIGRVRCTILISCIMKHIAMMFVEDALQRAWDGGYGFCVRSPCILPRPKYTRIYVRQTAICWHKFAPNCVHDIRKIRIGYIICQCDVCAMVYICFVNVDGVGNNL